LKLAEHSPSLAFRTQAGRQALDGSPTGAHQLRVLMSRDSAHLLARKTILFWEAVFAEASCDAIFFITTGVQQGSVRKFVLQILSLLCLLFRADSTASNARHDAVGAMVES
jgi:hypothetical protein